MVTVIRYDFVINANQEEGVYLMRFAGLFDCKKLKAYGEALLVYNPSLNDTLSVEQKMKASSISKNASYNDFVRERLPLLGPLNYAPYVNNSMEYRDGVFPITRLKHIPDKTSKKGKFFNDIS